MQTIRRGEPLIHEDAERSQRTSWSGNRLICSGELARD